MSAPGSRGGAVSGGRSGLPSRIAAWFLEPAQVLGPAPGRRAEPAARPRILVPVPAGPCVAPAPTQAPGAEGPRDARPDARPGVPQASPAGIAHVPRPVVAVCGAARGCGVTTVARAVAAELAARDPLRSAITTSGEARGALPIGTPAAARLARLVAERSGVPARPGGRLCLAADGDLARLEGALRGAAALVLDVADRRAAPVAVALADHVILVAGPRTEPALADILAASLARVGPVPMIALNRAPAGAATDEGADADDQPPERGDRGRMAGASGPRRDQDGLADPADPDPARRWHDRADVVIPTAPAAARRALGGGGAGGAFGERVALLANRCTEP